jgi:inhibitor of cysteine peptidase
LLAAATVALAVACDGDDDGTGGPTVVASATATSEYPAKVELDDSDNGTTVRLARGGELTIALESNPSTGFSWYVGELAGPELEAVGEPTYVPPESTTPVVGAPGTQVFTFRTTDIGMPPAGESAIVQVALEYKRGFEPDVAPEKTFQVTVEIR